MRDKVDHLIEKTVKQRVSEHMDAFKKEVDRELDDQRKQNHHHVQFYLDAGIKPGNTLRMPDVAYPAPTKAKYYAHPYHYGHPGYNGAYHPYQYGPWNHHPGYGYPYPHGGKFSPRVSYVDGPFNYKYQPSKTIDVDLDQAEVEEEESKITSQIEIKQPDDSPPVEIPAIEQPPSPRMESE